MAHKRREFVDTLEVIDVRDRREYIAENVYRGKHLNPNSGNRPERLARRPLAKPEDYRPAIKRFYERGDEDAVKQLIRDWMIDEHYKEALENAR